MFRNEFREGAPSSWRSTSSGVILARLVVVAGEVVGLRVRRIDGDWSIVKNQLYQRTAFDPCIEI